MLEKKAPRQCSSNSIALYDLAVYLWANSMTAKTHNFLETILIEDLEITESIILICIAIKTIFNSNHPALRDN